MENMSQKVKKKNKRKLQKIALEHTVFQLQMNRPRVLETRILQLAFVGGNPIQK